MNNLKDLKEKIQLIASDFYMLMAKSLNGEDSIPSEKQLIDQLLALLEAEKKHIRQAQCKKAEEKTTYLEKQIDKLANFIMFNIPGEPSQNEGAVDTAIRLLKNLDNGEAKRDVDDERDSLDEGQPGDTGILGN